MTTRAGWAGLLTGLLTTLFIHPLFTLWQGTSLQGGLAGAIPYLNIAASGAIIMTTCGGMLAARWGNSVRPWRCGALGGLAGGLAGCIVFCLWGAAAAGLPAPSSLFGEAILESGCRDLSAAPIALVVSQSMALFLLLFSGGIGLGALGGWLARPHRRRAQAESFDKSAPLMALNVSITAVPASIAAAALAAAVFSRLSDLFTRQPGSVLCAGFIADWPLAVSLLLVLVSHFALTLVIPHEVQQAEHLCGLDEVKMGAYVGIGAAPALIVLLSLIDLHLFSNPPVLTALVGCTTLSLASLRNLFKLVLPRRRSFAPPQEGWQKTEASLFGTIASSSPTNLVLLCAGCGGAMVLPLYVAVFAVLIDVITISSPAALAIFPDIPGKLYLIQALVSGGLVTASSLVLTALYLFYMTLGRSFSKWKTSRAG